MKDKLMGVLQQFQDTQSQVKKLEVTGESGAGAVKVTLNGEHDALAVHIEDDILQSDKTVVEELVASAINDANRRIRKELKDKVSGIASNLGVPKDMDIFDDNK